MTRREFLSLTLAMTVTPALGRAEGASRSSAAPIPRRRLGRTGAVVSALGMGGFHVGVQPTPAESVRLIRAAVDAGVTFLDNCWDYNDGQSEERMGQALRDGWRERVFLMTKVDGRDRATAARQIDASLRRLRTDRLDLLQLHEVIRPDDPARAFAPGGAMEALAAARQAGKARFLGFTGHKSPAIHLAMLREADRHGFAFDAVQMPLNVLDAHHDSFERQVLPVLVERGIGVLGMKPLCGGLLPGAVPVTPPEALRYAMSLPVAVTITGIDRAEVLAQALEVARGFRPLGEGEIKALLDRTAPVAADGHLEQYKSTHQFDGTVQHPEWLGPA